MGLLDDAIREHLELKRRRGAEPGEIARVEREALDPSVGELQAVFDEHGDMPVEDHAHADHAHPHEHGGLDGVAEDAPALDHTLAAPEAEHDVDPALEPFEAEHHVDHTLAAPEAEHHVDLALEPLEAEHHVDLSTVSQETAELDMRAVLDEDAGVAQADASPAGPRVAGPMAPHVAGTTGDAALYSHQEEPLEWDTGPWPDRSDAPGEADGQGDGAEEPHQERLSFE
jgi:hypothetical protein